MDGANATELLIFVSEFPAEIISVIGTIVCVILFYIYLQRLDIQLGGDTSHQDDLMPIQETKVMTSTLPFSINFIEESSAPPTLTDGVQLEVRARASCLLLGFWVVDCLSFSEMLRLDDNLSDRVTGQYLEENLLDISHSNSEKYFLNANTSKSVHLNIRNGLCRDRVRTGTEIECDLGPTPRSKYPLVILMSLKDEDYQAESHDISIHTMLWVIHLPDSIVTKPLHIISHMLITSQGLVCDVQKMFMASDETRNPDAIENLPVPETQVPGNNDDDSRSYEGNHTPCVPEGDNCSWGMDFSRSCIVCQNAPITRVIIPCRHACVCELCLGVLNACPMCRGVIGSHFKLNSDGSDGDSEEGLSDIVEGHEDWKMRLWNMNDRLNAWFGFR